MAVPAHLLYASLPQKVLLSDDEIETASSVSSSSSEHDDSAPPSPKLDAPLTRTTTQGREWRAKSTIAVKSFWERSWAQKILTSTLMDENHYIVHEKERGPVPSIPLWRDQVFLIPTTFVTPVIQQLCFMAGIQWSKPVTAVIYFFSLVTFFQLSAWRFNRLGVKYGVFNEKVRGRDRIPDASSEIMGGGILMYFTYRIASMVYFDYDQTVAPIANFGWTYIIRWQLWFLVMDLFFYCYHRATHEHDFLWSIHAHHHQAKSPTMAHAILAGHAQHFIEIVVIPALSNAVIPMTFHERWVLYLWLAHIETMGHSGIRIHAANPNTWLACLPFGAELTIEDHDLHHRYGKSGKNFGKQTRFWDVMFGTCAPREESGDCTTKWL